MSMRNAELIPVFSSFWQAGYEGADHVNRHGHALDMNASNGHTGRSMTDYAALREFGITTVRESIGWRLVERDGVFDFSDVEARARAAQQLGLQICWTFCHYGWPDDLDLHDDDFVSRFARFCTAAATVLAPYGGPAPVYSPVNEISFTSWGLGVGMFRSSRAHQPHAGIEAKRQLVRAAIAGCDAIWRVTPGARILHCDPLIHIIAPADQPDWANEAANARSAQFDAWDMLCGLREPELGGAPRYLDLVGGNYYDTNQWEAGTGKRLWWHLGDARRVPLSGILEELHARYRRPILLAETGHVGSGRGAWIREVAWAASLAVQHGAEIAGICLYPVIDRPDWEDPNYWHHSGLWDVVPTPADPFARELAPVYAAALREAQTWTAHLEPSSRNAATLISTTSFSTTTITSNGAITRPHFGNCMKTMKTMIVFCHLRWDFVFQRPQHLMTQLARHYKIMFIEEPVHQAGPSGWTTSEPVPNLTVYRPHTAVEAGGFHDEQIAVLLPMLAELVAAGEEPVVWFYTPMALPLLQAVTPSLVVYDCMDELAAFQNSPKQLLQREAALLKVADLVFTGGPSLYEAKRERHARAYCFTSSVDAIHFQQAVDRSNGHPLQADIAGPRLGFYGVLDERFDAPLLASLADAHPEWQLVMVGPIVKIDPASLPQRANIHYLGQQPYQALPQFLAGWDVCLLPFALNEATRFISPTKVLEYMAAELPIVSTAIRDVEAPYGDIVAIGHNPQEFIAACEAALSMTADARATMKARMRAIVAATSWNNTVERMRTLIDEAIASTVSASGSTAPAAVNTGAGTETAAVASAANVNALRPAPRTQNVACAIIGGGPTGLSAAYHLGSDTMLFERHATVGGWCRSIQEAGFTFDYAGHIMFSNDPYVLKLYDILLGANQHWQMREAWVYSKQVFTRYPFQGALYGLPPDVIKECIVGAIEARYEQPTTTPVPAPAVNDCCADGSVALAANAPAKQGSVANFESFIYKVWGAGIAKHFAIPYNKKLWTVPLDQMETSWLGGRVPLPNLSEIIDGALQPVGKPMGPNARFGYPLKGGFQALVSGFLPHIRGKIELNADVVELKPETHTLALADGRSYQYEQLISTMPLPELMRLIGPTAPEEVRAAAQGLKHISIRCVNIGVDRAKITDKHWIYYPEDSIFHRIFVQGNASPECNAPGGFGFTCEISYSPWKPLPVDGDALIARCIADCIKVGMITAEDEILTASEVDMPYAYVVYDHARAENVAIVRAWLEKHDIILAGRYSEWEYYNSDHAFLAGKKAAETVSEALAAAPLAASPLTSA